MNWKKNMIKDTMKLLKDRQVSRKSRIPCWLQMHILNEEDEKKLEEEKLIQSKKFLLKGETK